MENYNPRLINIAAFLLILSGAFCLCGLVLNHGWNHLTYGFHEEHAWAVVFVVVSWGIWKSKEWAWWIGVVLSGLFGTVGLLGLLLFDSGVWNRTYPFIRVALAGTSIVSFIAAFGCLVASSRRNASR